MSISGILVPLIKVCLMMIVAFAKLYQYTVFRKLLLKYYYHLVRFGTPPPPPPTPLTTQKQRG